MGRAAGGVKCFSICISEIWPDLGIFTDSSARKNGLAVVQESARTRLENSMPRGLGKFHVERTCGN